MKKLLKILLLLSTLFVFSNANDININKVLKNNKQIMFFFHIPRCPYCERMLDNNFKDEEILSEINKNFTLIDIYSADDGIITFNDFSGDRKEFAKYIGGSVVPATLFMDIDGKIIHKAIGYRNIQEHLAEIKYVGTKSYLKTNLETFIQELEFNEE